jgi:anti-sigma B factor antagonist
MPGKVTSPSITGMTLAISVDDRRPPTVLAVGGDLDLNTAPELLQALIRLVDAGERAVVVDLAGVEFCDSSGLSVLVRVRNRLTGLGGSLALAGPTPIVQRVLEVSGLDEIFGTYPSVEAARDASAHGPVTGHGGGAGGLVE